VYTYKNGKFYTLYDFSAVPGDTWTVCWYGFLPPDTGQVIVNSTGFAYINGQTLRSFNVSRTSESCVGWYDATIVERIGCISNEYLFPDYRVECGADVQINGYFRCYSDAEFPLYSVTASDSICEYIWTGIDTTKHGEDNIFITPNPADDLINVRLNPASRETAGFSVFSVDGSCVITKPVIDGTKFSIDVSVLTPGFYILTVYFRDGKVINNRVLIK
jgi:hypothetical protein